MSELELVRFEATAETIAMTETVEIESLRLAFGRASADNAAPDPCRSDDGSCLYKIPAFHIANLIKFAETTS
jgi:hypothetical protein